jgi:Ca2+-binding RTX toxin-like protein
VATFLLTAGIDTPTGAAGVADTFLIGAAGALAGTDTIAGGIGAVVDVLEVQASMTLAAADFANVRDIERIAITAAAGASVTLADAMVASGDLAFFHVIGGIGADSIDGGLVATRALNLLGGAGNDWLVGGGGNDLLGPGSGADTVLGGAGNDTVSIFPADLGLGDVLDGGAGSLDVLRLAIAGGILRDATLRGFERIEVAAALTTALVVRIAAETAATAAAPLTVAGAGGADVINAAAAATAVVLLGEDGADRLVGGQAGDLLRGGALNDTLVGYFGEDTLEGGDGNDRLLGGLGNDLLRGDAGSDSINGGAGNDTIEAGSGIDTVDGGFGNDWLRFAPGGLGVGDRVIDEQGSADVLEVTGATPALIGTVSTSALILGIERFILGAGNDLLFVSTEIGDSADAGVVTVEGGAGNDQLDASGYLALGAPLRVLLRGEDGADTLRGGAGADTLDGGAGRLVAAGGAGSDLIIVAPEALAPAVLSSIDGGDGFFTDVLRLSEGGAVASDDLANVTGIEAIELSAEGNSIVIRPSLLLASPNFEFTVRGGAGEDVVDNTLGPAGENLRVELGAGDDSFFGGAGIEKVFAGSGNDRILLGGGNNTAIFGAGEFSALDVVTASTTGTNDTLEVTLLAGRTLGAAAFDGIVGIDRFDFQGAAGASLRLPSDLVTQSGQTSIRVNVDVNAAGDGATVDGRAAGRIDYDGSLGDDLLLGGTGADTLRGNGGSDTIVGGRGGDIITLADGNPATLDFAVITSILERTVDINGTLSALELAAADRVSGTESLGNYIAVEWRALGLADARSVVLGTTESVAFDVGANILNTANEIAGNAFGSLTAVRNAVGAKMGAGTIGDRTILVIGGADEMEFGVYLFEDGDNNATIDVADTLYLLAIGSGDVPAVADDRGFTLVDLPLF